MSHDEKHVFKEDFQKEVADLAHCPDDDGSILKTTEITGFVNWLRRGDAASTIPKPSTKIRRNRRAIPRIPPDVDQPSQRPLVIT
jgi:hypothetical protein